jgi:uncharacterized Zn-binding protein involved in type VI secretion
MGLGITRIGDVTEGHCDCGGHNDDYSGVVISGSPNVFSNGLQTGQITSVVRSDCGHESTIISGSNTVWTNGLNTARMTSIYGKEGDCLTGSVVGGSPNVLIG